MIRSPLQSPETRPIAQARGAAAQQAPPRHRLGRFVGLTLACCLAVVPVLVVVLVATASKRLAAGAAMSALIAAAVVVGVCTAHAVMHDRDTDTR